MKAKAGLTSPPHHSGEINGQGMMPWWHPQPKVRGSPLKITDGSRVMPINKRGKGYEAVHRQEV